MLDDVYKVYAVRYGRHEQRSSANYMGGIAMTFRSPLITTFGRLVGPHATLLVDTGFDEKRGLKKKARNNQASCGGPEGYWNCFRVGQACCHLAHALRSCG
jgi:hypothetical protein